MKQIILLILLLSAFQGFAQNAFRLTGKITDAKTGEPMPRATIRDTSKLLVYYSNDSGIFTIWVTLPLDLTISYLGYETKAIQLKKEINDTLQIKLVSSEAALKEVEVLPDLPKYLFYGSRETQVIDYEFWDNKTLVAVYNYFRKRCYLVLLDRYNNIIDEEPIPSNFENLYKSGIDKYYAVTTDRVFEVYDEGTRIGIKPVSQNFFYSKIVFYKAWHGKYLYISEQSKNKQASVFFVEDTTLGKSNYRIFSVIGDRENYKRASRLKSGMDGARVKEMQDMFINYDPVAEGDFLEDFSSFDNNNVSFLKALYKSRFLDRPVYTPIFTNDSNVLIFDFYKDRLNYYTFDGTLKDTLPISFHKTGGWVQWVYKAEENYFTAYTNDSRTSVTLLGEQYKETNNPFTLYYPNTSNLKVRGRYVYYLHQPGAKSNNVFLFRQKWTE